MHAVLIGGLGPLSPPGLTAAGRELQCAMGLAVDELNAMRNNKDQVELLFRDTAGSPERGVRMAAELQKAGAVALTGEYHSIVAEAVAGWSGLRVPFVCSSATLDSITAQRRPLVFRVCPNQSRGWGIFARHAAAAGARSAVILVGPGTYWAAGAEVLAGGLAAGGVRVFQIGANAPASEVTAATERALVTAERPTMLVTLLGYPDPMREVLANLATFRSDCVVLGDPAGRTIFEDWSSVAGPYAAGVPYLANEYADGRLTPVGERMRARFLAHFGREPSFVAYEGYDAMACAVEAFRASGDPDSISETLRSRAFGGTRAHIRFKVGRVAVEHQQWLKSPVVVVTSPDPRNPSATASVVADCSATPARSLRSAPQLHD